MKIDSFHDRLFKLYVRLLLTPYYYWVVSYKASHELRPFLYIVHLVLIIYD
jgi:hypothetical protein